MPTQDELYEIEVLDGELVEYTAHQVDAAGVERMPIWATPPLMQAAVAAATGFVAGAATLALLRRYSQSRLASTSPSPAGDPPRLSHGRTYLVHVRHLG